MCTRGSCGVDDREHQAVATTAGDTDPLAGVLVGDAEPGAPLLVAFGGLAGRLNMAPFEFFRLVETIPCSKIFLRDLHQVWYHRGIAGLGHGIDESAAKLSTLITSRSPSRIAMVGNSAGGYAALLFGHLIPRVDSILAFAPQTFLDRWNRALHFDMRWRRQISEVHRLRASVAYRDLLPLLGTRAGAQPATHVFASRDDRLDHAHARRLRGVPRVRIHAYAEGDHSLIKALRDRGALKPLLEAALLGDGWALDADEHFEGLRRRPSRADAPPDGA